MEGDFNLDDLIEKQRQDKKKDRQQRIQAGRTKRIEKHFRKERGDRRDREDRRDRNYDDRNNDYQRPHKRFEDRFQDRFQNQPNRAREQFNGSTLLVKGFVADVSTEDIFKLLKGKKVHKISTFLQNTDRSELAYSKDMGLDVKIKFQKNEDADAFMKEYSDKVLDGKHNLTFTFTRS